MTTWRCLHCDAHGVTVKSATDHMDATRHGVTESLSGRVAAGKKAT